MHPATLLIELTDPTRHAELAKQLTPRIVYKGEHSAKRRTTMGFWRRVAAAFTSWCHERLAVSRPQTTIAAGGSAQ